MIDQFGKVMVYVEDPAQMATFWEDTIGFTRVAEQRFEDQLLSVEIAPKPGHQASLVLFHRDTVAQMSPELNLGTPSILFGSNDAAGMRDRLAAAGVTVGELAHHGGTTTFNFADPEDNYFAVEQLRRDNEAQPATGSAPRPSSASM